MAFFNIKGWPHNIQKCIFPSDEPDSRKNLYLVAFLYANIGVGLAGIICYSLFKSWSVFGIAILIASASFGVGGVLGFLLGIPLHNQSETDPSKKSYKPNTNLERISEWLTTVLVGLSLIQFHTILTYIKKFTVFASPGLGDRRDESQTFAFSILIYFSISGFFTFYMWTKLKLLNILEEADNPSPKAINVKAISNLLSNYLNLLTTGQKEHLSQLIDKEGDWRTLWSIIDHPSPEKAARSQCMIAAMYRHYGEHNGIVLAFGNDYLLDNDTDTLSEKTDSQKPISEYSYPMNDLVRPYGMVFTSNEIHCENHVDSVDYNIAIKYKIQAIEAIFDEILKVDNNKNRISVSTGHNEKFAFDSQNSNHTLKDFKKVLNNNLALQLLVITKPIDDTKLKSVDILIVGDAQTRFKPEEIIAVENFVSQGGSLLVIGNAISFGQSGPS